MQNVDLVNELMNVLNDLFILLSEEDNHQKNKNKSNLNSKTLKEKAKNLLINLEVSNGVGTRVFIPDEIYKNKKIAFCFLAPGIIPSSVKYQIKKDIESNSHILILKGIYDNPIEKYFKNAEGGVILTNTKQFLPKTEFIAKIKLNKKDWNFNGIEKKTENGIICLLIPERQQNNKKQQKGEHNG